MAKFTNMISLISASRSADLAIGAYTQTCFTRPPFDTSAGDHVWLEGPSGKNKLKVVFQLLMYVSCTRGSPSYLSSKREYLTFPSWSITSFLWRHGSIGMSVPGRVTFITSKNCWTLLPKAIASPCRLARVDAKAAGLELVIFNQVSKSRSQFESGWNVKLKSANLLKIPSISARRLSENRPSSWCSMSMKPGTEDDQNCRLAEWYSFMKELSM
mmetsp:Transcript_103376/g.163322  ORF Transcript_103376/g.163322 Transcript_103376/m.163322 type:complete len:214 (-) Transcript_103376:770-1411(-)